MAYSGAAGFVNFLTKEAELPSLAVLSGDASLRPVKSATRTAVGDFPRIGCGLKTLVGAVRVTYVGD